MNERLLTADIIRNVLSRFGGDWTHIHLWADDVANVPDLFARGLAGLFSPNGALHIRYGEAPQPLLRHCAAEAAVERAHKTKGGPLWDLADGGTWAVIERPPITHNISTNGMKYVDDGVRVLEYSWEHGLWLLHPTGTPKTDWQLQQLAPRHRVEPALRSKWVRPWSQR